VLRVCTDCCCCCCAHRYLRPSDTLPIGTPAADVKPLALPEGWREKYAGEGGGTRAAVSCCQHLVSLMVRGPT
jgi:hypothetical protein